jgi:hypothetical protein
MADHGTLGASAIALPPHIVRHCGRGFAFWTSRNLQTHVAPILALGLCCTDSRERKKKKHVEESGERFTVLSSCGWTRWRYVVTADPDAASAYSGFVVFGKVSDGF